VNAEEFSINKLQSSATFRAFGLLKNRDKKRLGLIVGTQVLSNILDLIGVALIGVLGALAVNGVQSRPPGDRVTMVLKFLKINELAFQNQVVVIGVSATFILISRTLVSVLFTRKTLFFLSRKGAEISSDLFSRIVSQPLVSIQSKSTQETLYIVTAGVSSITVGLLGSLVSLTTDFFLLIFLGVGLLLVDINIAIASLVTFGLISALIYKYLHARARELGAESAEFSVLCNEKIVEVLSSYRELFVRNRRFYYANEISDYRMKLASNQAESAFMPNISKYIIETVVVLGMLLISASQFVMQDASHAVATLSVFMAAGSRIAPAILRIQQCAISVKGALGSAEPTLELIEKLSANPTQVTEPINGDFSHSGFVAEIQFENVCFKYPGSDTYALHDITFKIPAGGSVAIVGPSGAGKTTLADVMLGVIEPTSGKVTISDSSPQKAIETWPGAIGYVPQDVVVNRGSVRENIGLGFPSSQILDSLLTDPIKLAQLESLIETFPLGVDTEVGERGTKLSGGQRQRIGIARSLFTKPKLLILDEATSSLDGSTEADFTGAISELTGNLTLVTIAHRLSTIRQASHVIYLSNGKLLAQGSIKEVRMKVPEFEKLAKEMGL
jgi:ABC-type multidrug transport system fused ATPase/permease subunit